MAALAPRPKALLVDLGNVAVRLNFRPFFERLGPACAPPRDPRSLPALLGEEALGHMDYERGRLDGRAWHARLSRELGLTLGYEAWLGLWNDVFLPNEAMQGLLQGLSGRTRFWGLSNTNADHLRHLRDRFRVMDVFEGVTASCGTGARKPEAAIYAAALESLGLAPGEVLYLDDVEDYVRAAGALGIPSFHYTFNDDALRRRLEALGLSPA